jgi:hypothetical protein
MNLSMAIRRALPTAKHVPSDEKYIVIRGAVGREDVMANIFGLIGIGAFGFGTVRSLTTRQLLDAIQRNYPELDAPVEGSDKVFGDLVADLEDDGKTAREIAEWLADNGY